MENWFFIDKVDVIEGNFGHTRFHEVEILLNGQEELKKSTWKLNKFSLFRAISKSTEKIWAKNFPNAFLIDLCTLIEDCKDL